MTSRPHEVLLDRVLAAKARYGGPVPPPCPPERIEELAARVRETLSTDLPAGYADFLRRHDGLNWNGLFLYSGDPVDQPAPAGDVQGLLYANLGWRDDPFHEDHLVLGEGNMDLYVRHLPTGEYRVIDRVPGNTIEVVATVDELLAHALAAHL